MQSGFGSSSDYCCVIVFRLLYNNFFCVVLFLLTFKRELNKVSSWFQNAGIKNINF